MCNTGRGGSYLHTYMHIHIHRRSHTAPSSISHHSFFFVYDRFCYGKSCNRMLLHCTVKSCYGQSYCYCCYYCCTALSTASCNRKQVAAPKAARAKSCCCCCCTAPCRHLAEENLEDGVVLRGEVSQDTVEEVDGLGHRAPVGLAHLGPQLSQQNTCQNKKTQKRATG